MKEIFARFITFLVAKFLPNQQLVDTYPVPAHLSQKSLAAAIECYDTHRALDARGQAHQLFRSQNPVFMSLEQLANQVAQDSSFDLEVECLYAIGAIMRQVALRRKNNARV